MDTNHQNAANDNLVTTEDKIWLPPSFINHKARLANEQVSPLQRPITDDPDAWKAYWKAQGWLWRAEPEIDAERQKYLAERRAVVPDIEQGIYPFKDIKLGRADVEWLLVTHENGRGPVDWSDESQREREGLDLRGANLQDIDLSNLPLACIHGGLENDEWLSATKKQRIMAVVQMERAILNDTQLEGANLSEANLKGAYFHNVKLEKAELSEANLERADFFEAQLKEAYLSGACLNETSLIFANLNNATLNEAQLTKADLRRADLTGVLLHQASLKNADLSEAKLDGAYLKNVTVVNERHVCPKLVDIQWGEVNLAVVKWSQVEMLGDEHEARQKVDEGKVKSRVRRLGEFGDAARANRQLAVVLQAQGLNEQAAHFAYRAQMLQRVVLRRQKKFGQYLFSGFLDLLAGYGYRPSRSVIWYLAPILFFALAYFAIGHLPFFPDAFVFSLTSFHGRGFFPGLGNENSLHNPLVILAAFEAVVGLLIEISFIATFTQRFFGR